MVFYTGDRIVDFIDYTVKAKKSIAIFEAGATLDNKKDSIFVSIDGSVTEGDDFKQAIEDAMIDAKWGE
jgi:hypothetical protein